MPGHRLDQLVKKLGWPVKEIAYYEQALTHSSFAYEYNYGGKQHNERLEFLGDAVLELMISDYLYHRYKNLPEGKLTRFRADIVCEATLARLAENLQLGDYLLLGKGEAAGGGHKRPSLLADALEALIGALYLDLGYQKAYVKVISLLTPVFKALENGFLRIDYKTLMQELTQSRFGKTPQYNLVAETGPDHEKIFEVQFLLGDQVMGKGTGRSKKEAEQAAAKEAWEKLKLN